MTDLEKNIDRLEKLAIKVAHLAREDGLGWNAIYGEYISSSDSICGYNAEDSDHQSALIFGIDVALHPTPEFRFTKNRLLKLDEIIDKAEPIVKSIEKDRQNTSEKIEESKRLAEIKRLKKRITELEENDND